MRLPRRLATSCRRFWDWLISPSLLFAAVLLAFPAFLFQKNLTVLAGETISFFLLALTRREKLRLLPSILMVAGITFFSLFSPHGQVLARIGGIFVTAGAVEAGLARGMTLVGMVFLSQLAVSPQVRLPGRAGAFVVDVFSVLDGLGQEPLGLGAQDKGRTRFAQAARNLGSALDNRLYRAYWQQDGFGQRKSADNNHPAVQRPSRRRGVAAMVLWLAALYGLLWTD